MTHHQKEKLAKFYLFGLLTVLTAILFTVAFWWFYPYQTTEIYGTPEYKTDRTSYEQNSNGSYTVTYCKQTNIIPTVTKKFEDGIEYTSDDSRAVLQQGCHTQQVSLHIPETLPPGKYRLEITLDYQVNPIRDITASHFSNWFTVTRASSGAYGDLSNNGIVPVTNLREGQ